MKIKLNTTLFLIFLSGILPAQTTLNNINNGLFSGGSYLYREIQFPDPGNGGARQVWDFTDYQYTGTSRQSAMNDAINPKLKGASDYNLTLLENGYDYYMNQGTGKLEECGYTNDSLKLNLAYSDPVIKMKYPFSYGDQFTDHFIGVAWQNETNKIDFFGDHFVSGDGYGTLILPDLIAENTLRVKSQKKGLQINMCGMTNINLVKYSWYAPGFRYPILSVSINEIQINGGELQVTRSAYTNTQQNQVKSSPAIGSAPAAAITEKAKTIDQAINVNISPNPFTDKLSYSYSLNNAANCSIELYSVRGKNNGWLLKNQLQEAGLHTGELDPVMFGMAPGIYFLRFTFDKTMIIKKVVKI